MYLPAAPGLLAGTHAAWMDCPSLTGWPALCSLLGGSGCCLVPQSLAPPFCVPLDSLSLGNCVPVAAFWPPPSPTGRAAGVKSLLHKNLEIQMDH